MSQRATYELGAQYGKWTIVFHAPSNHRGNVMVIARCVCGRERYLLFRDLRRGHSTGCHSCAIRQHGEGAKLTPEYIAWRDIKKRCTNPTFEDYASYGGRGITMCQRWADSYDAFLFDVGRRPTAKHSIDRIDNDGHYEPGNVKWSTKTEQSQNRRDIGFRDLDDKKISMAAIARHLAMPYTQLTWRFRRLGLCR